MSIEQAYNIWANQYDTNENRTRDLDKKCTIETLSKYEFSNVLELGCGTGKNTEWLLAHAQQIIGLDFSEEMLNKAKEKIVDTKVTFKKADLTQNWGVDNNFFDLITCSLTLEHIENLDYIFNQAYLKLKKNGLFFISELHPFKQYSGSKARYETEAGTKELEVYIHHVSEYINEAKKNGLQLLELKEWFDEGAEHGLPRLISFIFKK
ncbi:class I SAM-dependent DNA methyltransferase [Algibacter lectus]|uniref:class I SAM-dependent DNA methyltransferase n=1 Tax=Algibacter lectus TaxID=221126 RepID=UPI0026EAE23B|nr:class I SAM-dependent methyltransferase [Algibacter lectus]MDO7138268.1 class I SAM-dependent methyltransferase [Algibacter lectus]